MKPLSSNREVVTFTGISNAEFLEQYAATGRIGLAGGALLIDRVIRRAERHVDDAGRWSDWSHAFIIGERRVDGHYWVLESNLQMHRKRYLLGVQENRVTMYHDEVAYGTLAVLDLGLSEQQVKALLSESLELMANKTKYSLRELFGTLLALRRPQLRGQENKMARDQSLYCSAFVQHVFRKIGIDLSPGVDVKNTTPEDIARTPVPHTAYVLHRDLGESKVKEAAARLKERVRARVEKVRQLRARIAMA